MYKLSNRSKEKLKGLHPNLINFAKKLIEISIYDFAITHGVRTTKEQQSLYAKGRTKTGTIVTNCDGLTKKSNHQIKKDGFGHAFDIVIIIAGHWDWDIQLYKELVSQDKVRKLMEEYNIEWGGDWKSFKDYPHFEYKGGVL